MLNHRRATCGLLMLAVVSVAATASAQMSLQWIVPAAANTVGLNGTDWHTDLSLHNPHDTTLPVVVQFLPSDTDNSVADTLYVDLGPWQTVNLWNVLGPDHFAATGTGSLLVFADWSLPCDGADCDFLVTSRTYTLDPDGGVGEFGQTIPGTSPWQGVDWSTLGYAAGILNDGVSFRSNYGIASWTADWTTVAVDVQDADGTIVERLTVDVPPFGHVQRRLPTPIEGGSVVFWLDDGPDDAMVWGYVSVVDQVTGDASFQLAQPSTVGFAAAKRSDAGSAGRRPVPAVGRQRHAAVADTSARSESRPAASVGDRF